MSCRSICIGGLCLRRRSWIADGRALPDRFHQGHPLPRFPWTQQLFLSRDGCYSGHSVDSGSAGREPFGSSSELVASFAAYTTAPAFEAASSGTFVAEPAACKLGFA